MTLDLGSLLKIRKIIQYKSHKTLFLSVLQGMYTDIVWRGTPLKLEMDHTIFELRALINLLDL